MRTHSLVAVLALTCSLPVSAQQQPGPLSLTVHPLKGGVYWVSGGASNTGFVVGAEGVVVVDAQMNAVAAKQVLAEIGKITPKPVNNIVVTHGDPDHVGGLTGYPDSVTIIAHENTEAQIQASAADPNGGPVYGAVYKALATLPLKTIANSEKIVLDGVHLNIMYLPAHSSGDLAIYLPAQKIVFGGDILLTNTGRFPVIHIGGSSEGWITAVKTLLALDANTYIPGHGNIETKAQLQARLLDVEQRRVQIKAMVEQNKSRAEVEQALPEPGANPMFPTFTQTVYDELKRGYPPAQAPWANLVKPKN